MPETDWAYADALLVGALEYAAEGLYVFPAWVTRGENGKKVVQPVGQWRKAATRDPTRITHWWGEGGQWRGAHICIDMGGSGLVALDGDGQRGMDALRELAETGMPIGNAVTTPGGGQHWYYAEDYRRVVGIDSAGKVAPGVDVRGMGGFVFAPPSRDWRGGYEWLDRPVHWDGLAVVPDVIIERMRAKESVEPAPVETIEPVPFDVPARQFTTERANAFVRGPLDAFRALRTPEDKGFNAKLNDLACTFSHFVPEFITAEAAEKLIYDAAVANRSVEWQGEAGVRQTIRSGLRQTDDPWRAVRMEDAAPFVERTGPVERDKVDALLAEMLTATQVRERPPPVPLIMDFLDLDSLAWLIGKPGSKKSFLALDWAGHIGRGDRWRGYPVHQGEVVYIVAEGVSGMSMRVRAWEEIYGEMKGLHFLPRPVLAKGEEWPVLVEACRRLKPVLIILDTQARVAAGMEENSNTDMGLFIHQAERLREATGGCVLIVHHIGRNGEDARGASALDGAQGTEIKIARSERGPLWSVISQDKQKDMAELEDLEVELELAELGLDAASGRRLSSLRFKPVNPFDTVAPARVEDWIDNLASNEAEVAGVMRDHFPLSGATKAELKRVVQERRRDRKAKLMADGSWAAAWDVLATPVGEMTDGKRQRHGKGVFVRIKGTQRYVIDPDRDGQT